ncbi:MAG: FMN-binding protein [Pirellulaceae bacterium]|nr:FMN-binding protein [Pirellulaceae bacterium]
MSHHSSVEESFKIYSVVLSVGVVCSLAIVSVYEVTRPIIQRNRIALRQDAIHDVLPATATIAAFQLNETTGQFQPASPDEESAEFVFAGFDRDGELVGLAIETRGMGYQDVIRLLYGYSLDEQAIIGIRVLESRETPGLGNRIETDTSFLSNFARLDVALDPEGTRLAHPIEFVKSGTKTNAWQVDGITGATISSRATAKMLGDSAAYWIPRIQSGRTDFTPTNRKGQ